MIYLEKEFQFFLDNRLEIVDQYNEKYIVIVGNEIVGNYNTNIEAYNESIKNYKLGTFLIQKCGYDESTYTVTY